MSITLVAVKNPKWFSVKTVRLDSDGKVVNDSDGNPIMDAVNDSDGNPKKMINCDAKWSHLGDNTQEWLPFSANKDDVEKHGRDLYAALVNGDHGTIADE